MKQAALPAMQSLRKYHLAEITWLWYSEGKEIVKRQRIWTLRALCFKGTFWNALNELMSRIFHFDTHTFRRILGLKSRRRSETAEHTRGNWTGIGLCEWLEVLSTGCSLRHGLTVPYHVGCMQIILVNLLNEIVSQALCHHSFAFDSPNEDGRLTWQLINVTSSTMFLASTYCSSRSRHHGVSIANPKAKFHFCRSTVQYVLVPTVLWKQAQTRPIRHHANLAQPSFIRSTVQYPAHCTVGGTIHPSSCSAVIKSVDDELDEWLSC